jgi:hypothetical protein
MSLAIDDKLCTIITRGDTPERTAMRFLGSGLRGSLGYDLHQHEVSDEKTGRWVRVDTATDPDAERFSRAFGKIASNIIYPRDGHHPELIPCSPMI